MRAKGIMRKIEVAVVFLCLVLPPNRVVAAFSAVLRHDHARRACQTKTRLRATTDEERNMSLLQEWASTGDVRFAENVALSKDGSGDWGICLSKSKYAGDVVLSVPKSLALSSIKILKEFGDDVLQPAIDILESVNMDQYKPEFLLFVKILTEKALGASSKWYPWLASLPKSFDTGVYMDELERSCLPKVGLALVEYEDQKLDAFGKAANSLQTAIPEIKDLLTLKDADEVEKWAFNIVFSRCWRYSSEVGPEAEVDILPLGDMFNHREPADVMVQDFPYSDRIDFVLVDNVNVAEGEYESLHLSYGLNNPYRFLIIFGFVDENMPEIFSQVIFTDPGPELIELGCNDRSKMVFRTQDGAVANAVWDTVLYALLESRPDDQKALYDAHVQGNKEARAAVHAKFALEAAFYLRKHVLELLSNLAAIGDEQYCGDEKLMVEHKRLSLVCRHNNFLRNVFQKVKTRLDEMVEVESRKRLAEQVKSSA